MSHSRSALPPVYYAIFGVFEPTVTLIGFIGALMDPTKARPLTLQRRLTLRNTPFDFPFPSFLAAAMGP
jgi:hypothetical protein